MSNDGREIDKDDIDRLTSMIEDVFPYSSGIKAYAIKAFRSNDAEEIARFLKKARREAQYAIEAIDDVLFDLDVDVELEDDDDEE